MTFASLALAVLKVGLALLDHLERRRLLKEGEMQAFRKIRDKLNEKIASAAAARLAVDHSADSVSSDPNNRDNA